MTLYTDGSWLQQVWQRLEWFPLYRAEAVFILPLSVATFLRRQSAGAVRACSSRVAGRCDAA